GVFMRDEGKLKPYEHVVIRGNLISGGMYNGIVVFGAKDVTIDGNVVQGFSDMKSWIQVSRVDGAVLTNNSANEILTTDTALHVSNLGSTILGLADDRGAATVAQWHVDHLLAPTAPPLVGPAVPTTPTAPAPQVPLPIVDVPYAQFPGGGPIFLPDFGGMNTGFNGWINFA
ncbi:MAG TPA: right-handed parallel beta-helix repeat-containing protein, partial [Phenylobacterium sp.]